MINVRCNEALKKMGAKYSSGAGWTAPEGAQDVFDEINEKYYASPIRVEVTLAERNAETDWLGTGHAITLAGYVVAVAYSRDGGAKIQDGVAIISGGGVKSGGSQKNYRCQIEGGSIRVRLQVGQAMLDEIKTIEGLDLVEIDVSPAANPLEKYTTAELMAEISRRKAAD